MRIILLQLLIALFLLKNSLFALADDTQSYIGEYAQKNVIGKNTKVDFPRCRQIQEALLVNDGDMYILSECDIEKPKIKSIRIWRTRLDRGIGLRITGEIILPWRKIDQYRKYPLLCNRKNENEFNVGGYIGFIGDEPSIKKGLAYFLIKENGTIEKVPYAEIDSCDMGEGGVVK
jgi:hypothetical protein